MTNKSEEREENIKITNLCILEKKNVHWLIIITAWMVVQAAE